MIAKARLRSVYRRSTAALLANGIVKGALRAWIVSVIALIVLQLLDRFFSVAECGAAGVAVARGCGGGRRIF